MSRGTVKALTSGRAPFCRPGNKLSPEEDIQIASRPLCEPWTRALQSELAWIALARSLPWDHSDRAPG